MCSGVFFYGEAGRLENLHRPGLGACTRYYCNESVGFQSLSHARTLSHTQIFSLTFSLDALWLIISLPGIWQTIMRYNTATVCIHVHVFFCAFFHALQHLQTLKKSCPVINIWSICLLFCTFPEVHSYQWIKVRFMINSD